MKLRDVPTHGLQILIMVSLIMSVYYAIEGGPARGCLFLALFCAAVLTVDGVILEWKNNRDPRKG